MTIIEQLNKIYFDHEWWHKHRETPAGITNYHQGMLDLGVLTFAFVNDEIVGYFELFKITPEQLKRLNNNEEFIAPFEDIKHGDIAYLSNLWVKPDKRQGVVFKELRQKFLEQIKDCKYICGHEAKNIDRLRIYKRS